MPLAAIAFMVSLLAHKYKPYQPKKEPRRVGTVPLNEIKERQTTDLGLDLGGLEPYGCGERTRYNTNSTKSEVNEIKEQQKTSLGIERFESDYMVGVELGLEEYFKKHKPIQFIVVHRR